MRRQNSIGTLAAALAKAQGELVNPEKSLVATIRADGPGGGEKTFRYAPLSSGLDIVRKILRPARDCDCANNLDRSGCRRHQFSCPSSDKLRYRTARLKGGSGSFDFN